MFGVNPLGVQADGTLSEGAQKQGGMGTERSARDSVDLSADFVYQSKGRLTDYGYEVEIRVPFKSLAYQASQQQTWGINVIRKVQHSGHEDTWTPVRRANASFLAQIGTLQGLSELTRGVVLDVNPVVTAKMSGALSSIGAGWAYDPSRPQVGGNLRWGVTNNLTLNGTVKPDFSQVEADVAQIAYDPRVAVFLPEKRPFFLEGIEQFEAPNQLIYTRRVAQPVAAVKLSGKLSGTNLGVLSAVDDQSLSATGTEYPIYNLARLRRPLGPAATGGIVYTDRIDGDDYNRVAGADLRLLVSKSYGLQVQGAQSFTRTSGTTVMAPLWEATLDRAGRGFGLHYDLLGVHPEFTAAGGFISRRDVVTGTLDHRFTVYGHPGAAVESLTGDVMLLGNWHYQRFLDRHIPDEVWFHITPSMTLRGGWKVGAAVFLESYRYDPSLYTDYAIERHLPTGVIDTVPYV